ncbi:mucoidy inhibitor MuiA family protein [Kitasatospora brasiliensis]|uniref:mucoidy inhibitor MuiA family protein n=1 Tax=Kitasatospora brasiliensis TaxID=3058040 RepID=UPI002930864B|nr:mucoidy inhibitor MuiA family protein [Kitasatospora sp. K002]
MDDQHSDRSGRSEPLAVPAHPSVLDSVVVYAEGAVCRRRATVPLPPDGRLRLTGLPSSLDGRSLRARVLAGPTGTAVTEARLELLAELREPDRLPELSRALDEASEHRGSLAERRRLVLAAIAETSALRAVPPQRRHDEPLRRTPADAWLELADFVDQRLARLQERAEELTRQLELADHERDLAADRLQRESTAGLAEPVGTTTTALLTLTTGNATESAAPGTVDLELEYGVPAARWVPAYRLSYRTGSDTAHLVLRATVAQRTGEDWTGVRLALSTADLDRRTDLPRLASLRIGRSQPAPAPSGWREPPAGLADLFTGYDAAGADRPAPRRTAPVPVSAGVPSGAAAPRAAHFGGPAGPRAELFAAAEASTPHGGGLLSADEPMPPAPGGPAAPGGFAGYGAPAPTPVPVAAVAPATPMPKAPGGLPPREARRRTAPPPPTGFVPDAALLDYPDLVLAGPEAPAARRGTLHPRPERTEREELSWALPGGDGGARVRNLALPRHAVPPRVSAGSFDHRFDAAAPADIPSDGTWHTVTVAEIPLAVRPEYVTVPAVEEKVYATLVLANRGDQAVLAGPVEVTVDDDFLLTAALPTLAPGGTRRLGIGVAESIEVARRTELRESTSGMLKGNTTALDHRVHVRLANRLARAVTVEVRERVPVTSDAEIRIEERADWHTPAAATPDCPPSTRLWRVDLPPGGRVELDGGYLIKIPAGKAIVGGNRRN